MLNLLYAPSCLEPGRIGCCYLLGSSFAGKKKRKKKEKKKKEVVVECLGGHSTVGVTLAQAQGISRQSWSSLCQGPQSIWGWDAHRTRRVLQRAQHHLSPCCSLCREARG